MKNREGQSVVEFFVLVIAVFFIFSTLVFVVYLNIAEKNTQKINLEIKDVAYNVQDEINLAASSTNGYYREFSVPMKIGERDYEVNITDGSVYLRTSDGRFAIALAVLDVEGDVKKGNNVIRKMNESVILNG